MNTYHIFNKIQKLGTVQVPSYYSADMVLETVIRRIPQYMEIQRSFGGEVVDSSKLVETRNSISNGYLTLVRE